MAFLVALVFGFGASSARASSTCDALLRPDAAQIDADYGAMQAYMALNAAAEYDRLAKLDEAARGADAGYLLFATEYDGSRSPEEFRQRVRSRLRDEGYPLGSPELRGDARMHLSDRQISDWTACAGARSGALLVVAGAWSGSSVPLKVSFAPPAGVDKAQLVMSVVGGAIDGNPTVSEIIDGKSLRTYAVKPDGGSERLIVSANVAGFSDRLIIDRGADAPVASISACDELVAVESRGGGLMPAAPANDAAKARKPWGYGCKAPRRVVARLATGNDAGTTVSVCDAPIDVTYRRKSGEETYLLSPATKPGAAVMQACRKVSERKVATGPSSCARRVPALVCSGPPRPISSSGDVLVPGSRAPYAFLCEAATTQPVCSGN